MTEMEIREEKFYLLKVKKEKVTEITLHSEMDSPIERIKKHLKTGVQTDSIELQTMLVKGDKLEGVPVPWDVIATGLVKRALV